MSVHIVVKFWMSFLFDIFPKKREKQLERECSIAAQGPEWYLLHYSSWNLPKKA